MLLFAFAVVAIAAVSALVLGASNGYSAVRSSQNAADASATAAAATLHQVFSADTSPLEVLSTAVDVAEENGADQGSVTCEVVTADYGVTNAVVDIIGPCDETNVTQPDAAGVRVTVAETRYVPLGYFVGDDEITATAAAAATVQPVREGAAPFMVCANAPGHPQPLLESLDEPWRINDAAVGTSVVVGGAAIVNGGRDCGHGASSWRGTVAFESTYPIPSSDPDPVVDTDWWEIKTGTSSGDLPDLIAGPNSCGGGSGTQDAFDLVDCELMLPLCTHGNGKTGDSFRLHCVRLGAFEITFNSEGGGDTGDAPCLSADEQGKKAICADFLGTAVASDGGAVAGMPLPDEIVAIRLVE